MVPVSLKPSQKGVTFLIIVASVVFVCCLLAGLGTVQKIKAVEGEKAEVEKQVRDSQTLAQTQRDSENKYLDTRAQIRCLEGSVATQAYVPTLLKQIERLGRSVKLKVISVRPQPVDASSLAKKAAASQNKPQGQEGKPAEAAKKPEPPKPYDELKLDIELEGSYMNTLDFLYRLTSFQKIIAVNNVQIMPDCEGGLYESPRLKIKINVTAFVFKEAPPISKKSAGSAQAHKGDGNEAG